jgi:alpha-mannosidase
MLKHAKQTLERLAAFTQRGALDEKIYAERTPVAGMKVYAAPGRISYAQAQRGKYRPIRMGQKLGPAWSTHWFQVAIAIPRAWRGKAVHLLWNSGTESCVWRDGRPAQGLTVDAHWKPLRVEYPLLAAARGGEKLTLWIEAACNPINGQWTAASGELSQAEVAVFDPEAYALRWDFMTVADMAQHLPADSPRAGQALYAGNAMMNAWDPDDRATWRAARRIAADFLAAKNGAGQLNLSAVGHAHIDTAWLWPVAETRRKCCRTFATALKMMEEYPEYKFVCSQALQLAWMKESYPELYRQVRIRARQGRFIPVGGAWIEPDANIPSGESLVRQFLLGQRFYRREFGLTCREFWQPDVFGYSGALPQIMRGAGIEYFLTQKLCWNQFDKPMHSTFTWEGIDGSKVLAHFPPADNYSSGADARELIYCNSHFKDHAVSREGYFLFGHGDSGGGPTRPMLERLRRMKDTDGLPRIEIRSPQEFFARCAADIKDPPVWVGELYLEAHRGTYTTQARSKWYNRRSEELLHDTEFVALLARRLAGAAYPSADLEHLWEVVLLNQFHDILPGSSIPEVYVVSHAEYEQVLAAGAKLRTRGLDVVEQAVRKAGTGDTERKALAVNTLGLARQEVVELPGTWAGAQKAADGKALGVLEAPALGYAVAAPQLTPEHPVTIRASAGRLVLENPFVRAELGRDGHLLSLHDRRADRQAIAPGAKANHFVLFDDQPNANDAWDVDVFLMEKRTEVPAATTVRVVERGPLRVAVEFSYRLSAHSTLRQVVSLTALSPRLDFACEVDWHESHKFLKVEFPVHVRAMQASYEIQFGHLQRPTHCNTTWDLARFEVSAHHWADVSEADFGVALLNDCKYGYAVHGQVMRLSLLRSTKYPDPQADMGRHEFRYALLPHAGSLQSAGVIAEGYRFNVPLLVQPTAAAAQSVSFFQVDHPGVVIDTVKKAEDSDATILRLYESFGTHACVRLTSALPVTSAATCNLLEDDGAKLPWRSGGVPLELHPFEVLTLKLRHDSAVRPRRG